MTDPLGDVERYTYDPAGRMKAKVDKDGYETSFRYGKDGQVEEICYADGRTVSFTYNAIRQLEEVKDWLGTTRITMDEAGRVSSVTDPYGKTVGYEWGRMGERTSVFYPDGRKAAYEYNEAMQLTAMKLISNGSQEKTIRYRYDDAGRLTGKQFPGGSSTSYAYGNLGRVSEILHTGADFSEHYIYGYDILGNKTSAAKERTGIQADSGRYEYSYDEMNRLTGVMHDGQQLRSYSYDAFGNRRRKTEYTQNGKLITTYGYNTKNQLTTENSENGIRNYSYDHRGNLLSVTSGEEVLKAYGFDAANNMTESMGLTAGIVKRATYEYNGLGHRMGQNLTAGNSDPQKNIQYTLDLTRQYHNLLQKSTDKGIQGNPLHSTQTYFWDGNVTGMEEEGKDHFYFQDDLGSPMRIADEMGRSEETYGFDEFGNSIECSINAVTNPMQTFGFTGYQMDEAGGLYFAQARRYDSGIGRFVSEDIMRGHIAVPFTMNHYSYCWNRPMDLVDLNGMWPSLSDIGNGIKDGLSDAWDATKNWAKSDIGKVVLTTAAIAGVGALSVVTGGVAGVVLGGIAAGATAGAVSGGVSNMLTGRSFANGYVGGAVNGGIVGGLTAIPGIGPAVIPTANFVGGAIGKVVTTKLDEPDKGLDVIAFDALANGTIQAVIGTAAGKLFGKITHGNINIVNKVVTGDLDTFIGNNVLGDDIYAKIATGFVKYVEGSLVTSSSTVKDLLYDNLIGDYIVEKYEDYIQVSKGEEKCL